MTYPSLSKRYTNVFTAVLIILIFALFYYSSSETEEPDRESFYTATEENTSIALATSNVKPEKQKDTAAALALEQKIVCRLVPEFTLNSAVVQSVKLREKTFKIAAIKDHDIVSDHIIKTGTWEPNLLNAIFDKLKVVADARGIQKSGFIDIGANIGWYSLAVASQGYQVIAFEPMPQNEALFRSSLCFNPEINNRVQYHALGLGKVAEVCDIWSHNINLGDGHVACGNQVIKGFTDNKDYLLRASINVQKLDDVMGSTHLDDIGVVKMDTEGFELNVFKGGLNWLKRAQPPFILSEFAPYLMEPKGNSPAELLKTIDSIGYDIHQNSWEGPLVPPSEFDTFKGEIQVDEIFLISRAWKKKVNT